MGDVYEFAELSFGFNESSALMIGDVLPVGVANGNMAGTVDLNSYGIQKKKNNVITTWSDSSSVSGTIKIIGIENEQHLVIAKYNLIIGGATKSVEGNKSVSDLRISGTVFFVD